MTAGPDSGSGEEQVAKPPASLLTVPIFKDRPRRGRASIRTPEPPPETAKSANGSIAERPAEPPPADPPRAETPPAGPPAAPTAAPPADAKHLRQYWRRLGRGGRPAVENLDAAAIAANWPYTILVRVPDDGMLDIVRIFAPEPDSPGTPQDSAAHPLAQDHFSQLSAWVLRLAREAAGTQAPTETTESFALGTGLRRFTAQALPCESREDPAAYVLINIAKS